MATATETIFPKVATPHFRDEGRGRERGEGGGARDMLLHKEEREEKGLLQGEFCWLLLLGLSVAGDPVVAVFDGYS